MIDGESIGLFQDSNFSSEMFDGISESLSFACIANLSSLVSTVDEAVSIVLKLSRCTEECSDTEVGE